MDLVSHGEMLLQRSGGSSPAFARLLTDRSRGACHSSCGETTLKNTKYSLWSRVELRALVQVLFFTFQYSK